MPRSIIAAQVLPWSLDRSRKIFDRRTIHKHMPKATPTTATAIIIRRTVNRTRGNLMLGIQGA
jgi:hypothetical protein